MNEMDFDSFLSQVNEQDAQERERLVYANELEQRLEAAILTHNLPRLIDSDPEHQSLLQQDAISDYMTIIKQIHDENDVTFDTPEEEDLYLTSRAEQLVSERTIKESSWLMTTKLLIASYDLELKNAPANSPEPSSEGKKRFIADLLVGEKLEADDPWIIFINDVIPGETFDPQAEDAHDYLIQALEKHANQEEEQRKRDAINTEAYRIAGIDTTDADNSETIISKIKAVSKLIISGMGSSRLADDNIEQASSQRQADLHEICRGIFDADTTEALIAYIDQVYPLNK